MKRFLIISYWVVSILLVAVVLTSIGYRFLEALFIGSMFLPGALAAKYFFPKVRGVKDTVFLVSSSLTTSSSPTGKTCPYRCGIGLTSRKS